METREDVTEAVANLRKAANLLEQASDSGELDQIEDLIDSAKAKIRPATQP